MNQNGTTTLLHTAVTTEITVRILKFHTPANFAVVTLKFEQDGFAEEQSAQMKQMDLQTV